MSINVEIEEARKYIEDSDAILITAGAGMGVDSGLPDFRGNEGFWKAYPPMKDLGLGFEDMANPQWFTNNPSLAWAFYGHRLNLYRDTVPHEGFEILLDLVKQKYDNYFIYTSNVDGQFQKAGFDEEKIVEVHGSIHHLQCVDDCKDEIWKADIKNIEIDMKEFEAKSLPQCKYCSNVARPNILMFGDWSWNSQRTSMQERKFDEWLNIQRTENKKIAIIEIGAGIAIPTIRNLGERIAKRFKYTKLIRINPRDFTLNKYRGYRIPLGGLEGLKRLKFFK